MDEIQYIDFYINVETGAYPLTLMDIRYAKPTMSLPDDLDNELLSELGYARVKQTQRPVGDVVVEDTPILQPDGTYLQAFHTRPYTAGELAARANAARTERIKAGFEYTVNAETFIVQIEDRDFINLLLLKDEATDAPEDAEFTFRCKANVNHTLTRSDVLALCKAAFEYRRSVLIDSWEAKTLPE